MLTQDPLIDRLARERAMRELDEKAGLLGQGFTRPCGHSLVTDIVAESTDRQAYRTFDTGATRDTDDGKLDYEGFLSPLVVKAFAEYMHFNRRMADGSLRASDNWTKGIPLDAYMKSAHRHFVEWWTYHRGYPTEDELVFALCGVLFNVSGYLHEIVKSDPSVVKKAISVAEARREGGKQNNALA